MYPSTEMSISVQNYKLQYGKISPVLSTQITAPVNNKKKNLIFCTSTFISVTGAVICVLRIGDIFPYWSLYFCTEINISVLGYILLHWSIFYSTGKYTRTANEYVCVLRYRMQ